MKPKYHISDAAQMEIHLNEFSEFDLVPYSLYLNTEEVDLADVGPFLVDLMGNKKVVNWLEKEGYGKSWGIYINSNSEFEDIVKHLQGILIVEDDGGHKNYFRYYDPRVMKIFLPTCDANQLKYLFGSVINAYIVEDPESNQNIIYTLNQGKLKTEFVKLEEAEEKEIKKVPAKKNIKPKPKSISKNEDFDTIV